MSTRFPTEAANDDVLGKDSDAAPGKRPKTGDTTGADGTPRGQADGTPATRTERQDPDKPGGGSGER